MGKSIDPMLNGKAGVPADRSSSVGWKAGGGIRRTLPALIGSMSLQPAIPCRLRSRRACLRFTDRDQNAIKLSCWSRISQRTANIVLTVCVSQGDNRILL
jgi:hypothetical protein